MVKPEVESTVYVKELVEFNPEIDMSYLQQIDPDGENAWSAFGMENCFNLRYFIVVGNNGQRLGIVGVYDTADEVNITHVVIDPKYRGKGLLPKFYQQLMARTGCTKLVATIDRENMASIISHERAGFIKTSDEAYQEEFNKFKYVFSE